MPPVCYLLSLWRPLAGSLGKRASAIAADDLHTRMGKQPLFEGCGFAVGQQVHGDAFCEIDEHRSIPSPAAKAESIDPQHPRRGHLALLLLANQPQERIRTDLFSHASHQTLAC